MKKNRKSVARARLSREWLVIGLQGQQVGTAERCGIDLETGQIEYVVLDTPWQTLEIPWKSICVDKDCERFKLQSSNNLERACDQDSSA